MRRLFVGIMIVLLLAVSGDGWLLPPAQAAEDTVVYVIPIKNEIETGLAASLKRAFAKAHDEQADAIVLEINTLGGRIDAALEIGEMIRAQQVPVIAYVHGKAISAGAYIALNAPHLAMAPGSTIGAAEVRQSDGEQADPKVVAFWRAEMVAAAEHTERDTKLAAGMVDRHLEIPGIKQKEDLISFSAQQAVQHKLADGVYADRGAALAAYGYQDAAVKVYEPSIAEQIGRFVTHPVVIPILLILGLVGLTVEMLLPGHLLPGLVGAASLGLYFFGHMVSGFAGWEAVILFVAGLVLMIAEVFVAGFGIVGGLGIVALGAGVVMAAHDTTYGLKAMLFALLVSVVVVALLFKYFGHLGLWRKLILSEQQEKSAGYTPTRSYRHLMYQSGKTITPLRPSGTAVFHGQRLDVVSEGEYLPLDTEVQIVLIEGTRIVVRRKAAGLNTIIPNTEEEA